MFWKLNDKTFWTLGGKNMSTSVWLELLCGLLAWDKLSAGISHMLELGQKYMHVKAVWPQHYGFGGSKINFRPWKISKYQGFLFQANCYFAPNSLLCICLVCIAMSTLPDRPNRKLNTKRSAHKQGCLSENLQTICQGQCWNHKNLANLACTKA